MTEKHNPPPRSLRLAGLAAESGVPVATIKYYLREGLLPAGEAVSSRRAEYTDEHLRRLRLIRALIGVRGLSVARTRDILDALDAHPDDPHLALGLAIGSVDPALPDAPVGPSSARELVARLGWEVHPASTPLGRLDELISTYAGLFPDRDALGELEPYARVMEEVAVLDLDSLENDDGPVDRVEHAVVATFLLDRALADLRRLAQENESARRLRDDPGR